MAIKILVWRSVSVHSLRFYMREKLGGRFLLRVLYWFEERFPKFMGKHGAYPLVVIRDLEK